MRIKSSQKKNNVLQSSFKAIDESGEELKNEIKHHYNDLEVLHKSGKFIQDQCDNAKEELGKSVLFVIMEKTLLKENGDLHDKVSILTNKCNRRGIIKLDLKATHGKARQSYKEI